VSRSSLFHQAYRRVQTFVMSFALSGMSMSDLTTSLSSFTQDSFLRSVAQELVVIGVFFFSMLFWRRNEYQKRLPHAQPMVNPQKGSSSVPMKKNLLAEFADRGLPPRQRHTTARTAHGAQPHVFAAEQQMLQHLEQHEFTRALNMYRALERNDKDQYLSEGFFSAFIQSAIRVGKVDVVERMLRKMKRNGFQTTVTFWQTTLKMLSSRKHFSTCVSVHYIFQKDIPVDKVAYSCLINAALEVGAPECAASMLERYGKTGLEPKDYVLHSRTYVALGDADASEVIFRKLGGKSTTLILNLLLLTCVNTKQPERALALLLEAHALECGQNERIADVVSYNTVIKGFAEAGSLSRCFDCLKEMLERGLLPDDVTCGTLLDICIVDNDMGAASEVVNLLVARDRPMDTVMCTLFLKGLVRANCLPKAMEVYDGMKRREGAHPDLVTYSVLIKALVDQHDLERALHLMDDLTQAGLTPDDIILTHLLEGCRHTCNHALGKKLFTDMMAAGVKPSEFTLVTMLKLYGRCGAHVEAHELVTGWERQHGIKPSVIHYTCLMSGCLKTKNYSLAWKAYELMCESGVTPDETTISTILPGMVAAQAFDHVLTLAEHALKAPTRLNVPAEHLNTALAQMLAICGPCDQAERLQVLMRDACISITARSAKRFV